ADERQQVNIARETISKWVETRQVMAATRSAWESDREVLRQSIEMFEKELAAVNEQFEESGSGSEQIEKERKALLVEQEDLEEARRRVAELLAPLESRLKSLCESLPAPLLSKLEPLLARIPEDPAATQFSTGERMQTVVGIISEVEKFNGSITVN